MHIQYAYITGNSETNKYVTKIVTNHENKSERRWNFQQQLLMIGIISKNYEKNLPLAGLDLI